MSPPNDSLGVSVIDAVVKNGKRELLTVINQRIAVLLDREHQIGHSYFTAYKTLTIYASPGIIAFCLCSSSIFIMTAKDCRRFSTAGSSDKLKLTTLRAAPLAIWRTTMLYKFEIAVFGDDEFVQALNELSA